MKPDEIENYVQQMMGNMSNMLQPNMKGMFNPEGWLKGMFNPDEASNQMKNDSSNSVQSSKDLNAEMFETHDFIFVRVPLKDEAQLKQMKLFYTSNQVIIEHIPEMSDKHTLILPATVKRKGAQASHRDGVLELKLPKNMDFNFSEIDIS